MAPKRKAKQRYTFDEYWENYIPRSEDEGEDDSGHGEDC